jgi:NAD(P)-dependent dehydrogenase (short-subunit alcohol dehydrogenase family)
MYRFRLSGTIGGQGWIRRRQAEPIGGREDLLLGGVLVNNAGIFVSGQRSISDSSLDEWNRILGVNLTGAYGP